MFMESSNIVFRCLSVLYLYPSMCWHGQLAAIRLWYFSFPTHTELLMWRISSVAVTAVPFYTPLTLILAALLEKLNYEKSSITVFLGGPSSGGILYIIARAVTLVLAFTSLRYETVHWTTFIPHI